MAYEQDLIKAVKESNLEQSILLFKKKEFDNIDVDTLGKLFSKASENYATAKKTGNLDKLTSAKKILDYLCEHKLTEAFQYKSSGSRPLDALFFFGCLDHIKNLYQRHKITLDNLTSPDKDGMTPLHSACSSFEYPTLTFPLIEWLVSLQGIKLNHRDKYGRIPLRLAVEHFEPADFTSIIQLLVKKMKAQDLNIDERDNHDRPAAFGAIDQPNFKHLQCLHDLGADFSLRDQLGHTLEDRAIRELRDTSDDDIKPELKKIIAYFEQLRDEQQKALQAKIAAKEHALQPELTKQHARQQYEIDALKQELAASQQAKREREAIAKHEVSKTFYYQAKHMATTTLRMYEVLSTGKVERTQDTQETISGWIRSFGDVAGFLPGVSLAVNVACSVYEFAHGETVNQQIHRISHLSNACGIDQDIEETLRLFTVHLLSQLKEKGIELTVQGAKKLANCVVARLMAYAGNDKSLEKHIPENNGLALLDYLGKALQAQTKPCDKTIKTLNGEVYTDIALFSLINFSVKIAAPKFVVQEPPSPPSSTASESSTPTHSSQHSPKDSPVSSPGGTPPRHNSPLTPPLALSAAVHEEKKHDNSVGDIIHDAIHILEQKKKGLSLFGRAAKQLFINGVILELGALCGKKECSGHAAYQIVLAAQKKYSQDDGFFSLLSPALNILRPIARHEPVTKQEDIAPPPYSLTEPSAPPQADVFTEANYPKHAATFKPAPVARISHAAPPIPTRQPEHVATMGTRH